MPVSRHEFSGLEREHGIGAVQAAIQQWWRQRQPQGRVVFNREYGAEAA
jgi:hypothetical protein